MKQIAARHTQSGLQCSQQQEMHSQVRSGPGAAGEEIQADLPLQLNHVQNKPVKREMSFLSIAVILSLELKCV